MPRLLLLAPREQVRFICFYKVFTCAVFGREETVPVTSTFNTSTLSPLTFNPSRIRSLVPWRSFLAVAMMGSRVDSSKRRVKARPIPRDEGDTRIHGCGHIVGVLIGFEITESQTEELTPAKVSHFMA